MSIIEVRCDFCLKQVEGVCIVFQRMLSTFQSWVSSFFLSFCLSVFLFFCLLLLLLLLLLLFPLAFFFLHFIMQCGGSLLLDGG
jgi:hypothetical protein